MFRSNIVCPMVRFGGNGSVTVAQRKTQAKKGESERPRSGQLSGLSG